MTMDSFGDQSLHWLLESVPDPLVLVNEDGRIVGVNAAMASLFRYTEEDLSGLMIEDLVPQRMRGDHARWRRERNAVPQDRPMGSGLGIVAMRSDGSEFRADIQLRTRQMGGKALVDVHIILEDPRLSVSEGHQVSENVRTRLIHKIGNVEDVLVHIDPEDDETAAPCEHLDLREGILRRLETHWREVEAAKAIQRVTLHYLDGRVHVELELPLSLAPDAESAQRLAVAFREAGRKELDVADVRILFSESHQNAAGSLSGH